uniref:Uncharacterized protein n=1 Tax=Gallus gallus TaxID=9031 RepID=A0A3Q2U0Q8_CHICK
MDLNKHTWDGLPVSRDPVTIAMNVPFFNDPPGPVGVPGKPLRKLCDYEVVEAFFLSDRAEQDLEVELCKCSLLKNVTKTETKRAGRAHLPWSYCPLCTSKFNAFAIYGSREQRKYEVLFAVPQHKLCEGQKPDL